MVKEPWEEYPEVWATKAAFFAWMRGNLRRALWEKYPPKLIFKKSKLTKPPLGYTGKAKSGAICALTGEWVGNSKLQVDHIIGEASLKGWEDVLGFIQHLCTSQSNMQLVETEAHKIKSYAERMGISFEEAKIEKELLIPFKKLTASQQQILLTKQYGCGTIPSAVKRIETYRSLLKNGI